MTPPSAPPPPPLPREGPPPPPAVPDRNTLGQQRRAVALEHRRQRHLDRARRRELRRTSVVGPLLLLGLGISLLTGEVLHISSATGLLWLSRFWPVLLVVAGTVLLAEWALDARADRQHGTTLPRRRLGGISVLILLLLAGLGAGTRAAGSLTDQVQDWNRLTTNEDWSLEQVFANRSETQQDLAAPLPVRGTLLIRNYRGAIRVSGTSHDGEVHVSVRQRLWAWHDADLQRKKRLDAATLAAHDGGLLLQAGGSGRDETDLTITVPRSTAVHLLKASGELAVSETTGDLLVDEHQGSVELSGLHGRVQLQEKDEDASLSGHDLTGDVSVRGKSGDLRFLDLTGPLTLQGDFYGKTHLEHIGGAVHFESSRTRFLCAALPGEVDIEGSQRFDIDGVRGPVEVATGDHNVTLSQLEGRADIMNRDGDIGLDLGNAAGAVTAETANGSIRLTVDPSLAFALRASTNDGKIENNLGLTAAEHGDGALLTRSSPQGGPAFSLHTKDGDLRVVKRTTLPAASNVDGDK